MADSRSPSPKRGRSSKKSKKTPRPRSSSGSKSRQGSTSSSSSERSERRRKSRKAKKAKRRRQKRCRKSSSSDAPEGVEVAAPQNSPVSPDIRLHPDEDEIETIEEYDPAFPAYDKPDKQDKPVHERLGPVVKADESQNDPSKLDWAEEVEREEAKQLASTSKPAPKGATGQLRKLRELLEPRDRERLDATKRSCIISTQTNAVNGVHVFIPRYAVVENGETKKYYACIWCDLGSPILREVRFHVNRQHVFCHEIVTVQEKLATDGQLPARTRSEHLNVVESVYKKSKGKKGLISSIVSIVDV